MSIKVGLRQRKWARNPVDCLQAAQYTDLSLWACEEKLAAMYMPSQVPELNPN